MRCLACGTENRPGEMLCHACGDLLLDQTIPEVLVPMPVVVQAVEPDTEEVLFEEPFNTRPIPLSELLTVDEDPESLTIETVNGFICSVPVHEGTKITLGRGKSITTDSFRVNLAENAPDDQGVSRRHAAIQIEPRSVMLVDLGSTNGTYLNGRMLEPNSPHVLRNGDTVLFGRLQARVRFA